MHEVKIVCDQENLGYNISVIQISTHTTSFSSPLPRSSSTYIVVTNIIPITTTIPPSSAKIQAMVAQYAPLVLHHNLHEMPQNYQKDIPLFDNLSQITAQQHITRMNDFWEVYEIDETDVQMRLFAQSLIGEVKT